MYGITSISKKLSELSSEELKFKIICTTSPSQLEVRTNSLGVFFISVGEVDNDGYRLISSKYTSEAFFSNEYCQYVPNGSNPSIVAKSIHNIMKTQILGGVLDGIERSQG